MWEVWEAPEVVTSFGTLLAGVAACVGVFIAGVGLTTWKRQIKWQEERTVAKSLFVALRKRHEAIKHIRNPFGWSDEYELPENSVPEHQKKWKGTELKYQKRWDKLVEVRQEFYPLELEGLAYWGDVFDAHCKLLKQKETDLLIAIQEYIESQEPGFSRSEYFGSQEEANQNRDVVRAGGSRDQFGPEYTNLVQDLEVYLREKLEQDRI
jgi:hypothetical protein